MIWHFEWKDGHYCEWFDGVRNHLAFLNDEEYDDLLFDIDLS